MAFIIRKKSHRYGTTQTLYYLVNNYRIGNKIKRKTLVRLGICSNIYEYSRLIEEKEVSLLKKLAMSDITLERCEKYNKKPDLWYSTKALLIRKLRRDICRIQGGLLNCQKEKEKIERYIDPPNS